MSSRRILLTTLILSLATAGAAEAQYGGGAGGGGMGGGGRHGGGGRRQDKGDAPRPTGDQPRPSVRQANLAKVMIDGVVTRIEPASGRVTISYQEVEALSWPAGTMPFAVEKPSLLEGLTVGEKVRFHVESQQISSIEAIGPSASPGTR